MYFTGLIVLILLSGTVQSMTPEEKGKDIALKVKKAQEGFIGESSEMEMILIDSHGNTVNRKMSGKTLEIKNDGDKSLMTFKTPNDVKGTKMLTWTHKDKDNKQWLFLPSLKRVKRISSSSKTSSFMGSEFTYEDLGSQEPEKYKYKFIKEDKEKWVLERRSKLRSGYSRELITISKKMMSVVKAEYYDKKNELLKVGLFSDYRPYTIASKKLHRANKIHMKNVQSLKQSYFNWSDRKLGVRFSSSEFTKSRLK